MPKVAIVITRLDLGGAQEVALETARGLESKKCHVTLVAGRGGQLDERAREFLGARLLLLPRLVHPISPLNDLLAFFQLTRLFYKERFDVVHTHSSKAGLLGRMAAFCAGVPRVVHTVHGWSFHDFMTNPGRLIFIRLERMLARLTDVLAVVAVSCKEKGLLNGIRGDYRLLRAAVDLKAWRKARRLRNAVPVVGCIANCKEQKNPLDFVKVAAKVLEKHSRVRFRYVGDGPLKKEAEALATKLGISAKVEFLGWRTDALREAAGFDIFLLCSLWEGLPCVFPQALSMGIPVVATDVDGAAEIIQENKNGFLCVPRDIEALADRVLILLKDKARRLRMGAAAKKSVGKEFDVADMLKQTAAIYLG